MNKFEIEFKYISMSLKEKLKQLKKDQYKQERKVAKGGIDDLDPNFIKEKRTRFRRQKLLKK